MKVSKYIRILFAAVCCPCLHQHGPHQLPWLTQTERARFETLRIAGSEALFNLDYDAARKNFKEMAVAFPAIPPARNFWPTLSGPRLSIKLGGCNLRSTAATTRFYSTSDDKADPKVVDEFRTLTRQAKQLTEARLKQYPKDIEALYFMGAIEGLKAAFEEAVERRHYAALKDGSDAVDKHREVIKLDPSYRDAEIHDRFVRLYGRRAAFAGEDCRRDVWLSRLEEAWAGDAGAEWRKKELGARRGEDSADRSVHPRKAIC